MLRRCKERWIWYRSRSEDPVLLDPKRYPSIEFDGKQRPRPEWVCQGENGGLHIDARVGRIDVHVASHPVSQFELNWTRPYVLQVVARSWAELWHDLIDPERVFLGSLFLEGQEIDGWCSIHGIGQPVLRSKRMMEKYCNRCGNLNTWPRGNVFFDEPHIGDQIVFVNNNGVYIREDVVSKRGIRPPAGSYEPSYVTWKTSA